MAEKKIDAGEIQIEDPLDFLSPSEKKAYIRAHQDTLLRSDEEMERIREATEVPSVPSGITADADFEVEDLSGEEDGYEEDYEDDYEEEQPVKKPYVYQDTRLHTDERRSRAAKAAKPAKPEKPARAAKPEKPARQRVAYAAEAAVYEDDEVEETAFDYMLSVAVKAFLAAILIVALIMAYMVYVRPLIRRTTGLSKQAVETQEDTIGMDDTNAPAQGGGDVSADGEAVTTTTELNLRTAPNTETSEVITTLPAGHRLTRLSDDGEWSKVLFNGQELYCASAYLEAE